MEEVTVNIFIEHDFKCNVCRKYQCIPFTKIPEIGDIFQCPVCDNVFKIKEINND